MKMYVGLLLLAMASSVNASSIRVEGGTVLIKEGSPVYLLTEHLGEPDHRSQETVCLRRASGRHRDCDRWGHIDIWFYRWDNRNWTIRIRNGRILSIKWDLF